MQFMGGGGIYIKDHKYLLLGFLAGLMRGRPILDIEPEEVLNKH